MSDQDPPQPLVTPTPISPAASSPAVVTPPPFPDKQSETITATYTLPNVLKAVDSQNGRDVLTIISGGGVQIPILGEHWLFDNPVDAPPIFVVMAQNQIRVAGQTINVINDPVTFNGKTLTPSNPTASQYLAQVGKQVFTSFSCALVDPRTAVYKTYRAAKFGNANAPLYAIRQTSIVMP